MKDSWDSRDSCSTFNIIITVNRFTKLHQAGVSPALFSGFRPGRGKSPSDEMDSKMHPALRAVAEEWIQQELQGVQSSASILYFLPFGRTLIFISDNRWVSLSNNEHRWVGKMKCCIFALWFRKRSRTQISRIFSLQATVLTKLHRKKLRRSKNPWDPWDPCAKLNINPLKSIESNEESKKNRFDRGTLQCHTY